jgi:hypothetical protein
MVGMRRRAVANAAAKKNFVFSRSGGGDFSKASFGGDRSEAGRYAANIRWQGQTVDSPPLAGYSESMTNAEELKSQLHILASTTDTKLAELNGKLDRESQKFRQVVEYINKVAGVYEPTTAKEYSDSWRRHMAQQEQIQYNLFKNATPEERQKIIDLASQKANPYEKLTLEKAIAELARRNRNKPTQSRNKTT